MEHIFSILAACDREAGAQKLTQSPFQTENDGTSTITVLVFL